MGVFPAASSKHVPEPWAELMSDPVSVKFTTFISCMCWYLIFIFQDSTIIDFYPEDFKIDLNGKKFAWQGVALLPFVEEKRLFKALEPYYDKLTTAEIRRNLRGDDRLYVSSKHSGYDTMTHLYIEHVSMEAECAVSFEGMRGTVLVSDICVEVGG